MTSKTGFLLYLMLWGWRAMAQSTPGYDQLKTYQGTYAYDNPASLQIGASPKDGLLYALIGESKYPLRPLEKDLFLNNANQQVQFIRDANSRITGYKVNGQGANKVHPLLSKRVSFQEEMWFARGDGKSAYQWTYHQPEDRHDGLPVGSLADSGLDTNLIRQLVNRVVNDTYKDVHSVVLIKDGKLILEEYFYGFTADSLHQLRSATKSFTSALVGIAVDKGWLKGAQQKVAPLFDGCDLGNDPRKQQITLGDLLTQRSGLACDDDEPHSPGNETKVYSTANWIKTILALPMANNPGRQDAYCSGNVVLLNQIVEQVSHQRLADFARQHLLAPLGVREFNWRFMPDSTHQDDFGQLWLRPRDMAKFGLLYLNGGQWNGRQVISPTWVAASLHKQTDLRELGYGYLWWCEDLTVNGSVFKGFNAKGNGGQRIFLWPAQRMVAVVTAGNYNSQSPANKLLMECVLAGISSADPKARK